MSCLFAFINGLRGYRALQVNHQNHQTIPNEQKDCLIGCFSDDLIREILSHLPAESLSTARCVSRKWEKLASEDFLWAALLHKKSLLGKVRNLDNADLKSLGFPQVNKPTINSRELWVAAKIACRASENGSSTMVTIPEGWSWDDLEQLSEVAVKKGIPSAHIYISEGFKKLLRETPTKEEQTVVFTDTVIKGSRNKSIKDQQKRLKSEGFQQELPDALTLLTTAILTHISTNGKTHLYEWDHQQILTTTWDNKKIRTDKWNETWTRCANKTAKGYYLCIGFDPAGIRVRYNNCFSYIFYDDESIGVGGQRKFFKAIKV